MDKATVTTNSTCEVVGLDFTKRWRDTDTMPGRELRFVTNEIYHTFNRGIEPFQTFTNEGDYHRALLTLELYRLVTPPMRLSQLLSLEEPSQEQILKNIRQEEKLVDILSFCLMPNHFHLLLRQKKDGGVSKFMSDFQNSYTRFFNIKHERKGPLFLRPFKAAKIYSEQQLLHVSRYQHLNAYSASIVRGPEQLERYPWSSLPEYLGLVNRGLCEKGTILSQFKDVDSYRKFILDQADYQRSLEEIKHIIAKMA